jgi:hypothetical protein
MVYLFLLPSGAGGHADDPERLRAAAEFQGYEGWLLGCRDRYERRGGSRGRLRVVVTPLATVGTPVGALAAALGGGERAGRLRLRAGRHRRRRVMSDPDATGPDGTVRLRRYLRHENVHWFAAGCPTAAARRRSACGPPSR